MYVLRIASRERRGGGYLFIYLFIKPHFEIVYVLLYLNSCKIYLFNVAVLYCLILCYIVLMNEKISS